MNVSSEFRDMTCPGDHYIPSKEIENIVNYSVLRIDAEKLRNIYAKIVVEPLS